MSRYLTFLEGGSHNVPMHGPCVEGGSHNVPMHGPCVVSSSSCFTVADRADVVDI